MGKLKSNLPRLIKQWLKDTGTLQKDLANTVGIDASQLSRLLKSDGSSIDMELATKFRDACGFNKNDLIVEVEDEYYEI